MDVRSAIADFINFLIQFEYTFRLHDSVAEPINMSTPQMI